jgi:hypothetical protein
LELFPHSSSLLELPFPALLERSISQPEGNRDLGTFWNWCSCIKYGKGCCLTEMSVELKCDAALPLRFLYVHSSWTCHDLSWPQCSCVNFDLLPRPHFQLLPLAKGLGGYLSEVPSPCRRSRKPWFSQN